MSHKRKEMTIPYKASCQIPHQQGGYTETR